MALATGPLIGAASRVAAWVSGWPANWVARRERSLALRKLIDEPGGRDVVAGEVDRAW
jgi:hypothetical protein